MSKQFATKVLAFMALGDDFVGRVLTSLARPELRDSSERETKRLQRQMDAMKLQHRLGDITDEEY